MQRVVVPFVLAAVALTVTALFPRTVRSADQSADEGWVSLFNGKDLDGWEQHSGKAKFAVEDGQIVGTTVPNTENSFLCTKKEYADFILEVEFKVDPDLNSGVQIRSHVYEKPTTTEVDGKKRTFPADRVYGYQVEIDPDVKRGRLWTGGIYDEARRGWLADLKDNEAARKAFKPDEWNKLHIECKGDSIKTWVNGVAAADLHDSMTASGFIGLQVHAVKTDKPIEVRFRNLRIKELK
jgi:hypothetical protein